MSDLTYPEVGATAGDLPPGYHHLRESRVLGEGRETFDAACTTLMSWGMHGGAGVRRTSGPGRPVVDTDVAFRWLRLTFECRVIAVVVEADRSGFTYGTLAKHPECGEERFMIDIDPRTQVVTATITAFSKPSNSLVALAGPAGRLMQQFMTRRYLHALQGGA